MVGIEDMTNANDWTGEMVDYAIVYPSRVDTAATAGQTEKRVALVENVAWSEEHPVTFKHFINEYNAVAFDGAPIHQGTVNVSETSDDIVVLRALLRNNKYFDIFVTQPADGGSNWKPYKELFIGCRFTSQRSSITAEQMPIRKFAFKGRYVAHQRRGQSSEDGAVGDGWSETGETIDLS